MLARAMAERNRGRARYDSMYLKDVCEKEECWQQMTPSARRRVGWMNSAAA